MGRRTVDCVALVSALAGARVEAQSYLSAGVDIDLTTSAIRASIPVDHERPAHFNAEVGRYLDARTGVGPAIRDVPG